mmetsp:Transcript_3100/g.8470  ORF Transcript_3100/g.8470 Transcript_3100/m.8470 type:complete len:332 (-) Transcript_3100:112-1107(-)
MVDQELAVAHGSGSDRRAGPGKLYQGVGALVSHRGVLRRHEGQYELDVLALVLWLSPADRSDKVEDHELQNIRPRRELVQLRHEVLDGEIRGGGAKHQQGIPPRGHVLLVRKKVLQYHLARVRKELVSEQVVYRLDTHRSAAPHERVPVLQVAQYRRNQRLQDLKLLDPAQEPQRHSPQVLVRVLEVVPQVLADQYHLRKEFPIAVLLLQLLQVQKQQLLDRVILTRKDVSHDRHEQLGHVLSVEHHVHALFHGFALVLGASALKRLLNLVTIHLLVVRHEHRAVRLRLTCENHRRTYPIPSFFLARTLSQRKRWTSRRLSWANDGPIERS